MNLQKGPMSKLKELPGYLNTGCELKPASAEVISKLPAPVSGAVLIGRIERAIQAGSAEIPIVIVVPSTGGMYGYVDAKGNGRLKSSERFTFSENGEAEMPFPLGNGVFRSTKAKVKYREFRNGAESTAPSTDRATQVHRELQVSIPNRATATIEIDGREILFKYCIDLPRKVIDPTKGQLWVDCDGNGQLDENNNIESAEAQGEPVVFRVGKHYLATTSVDINSGEVVVEEHPASDYMRIELTKNTPVPDFTFKDFDGKRHQLAEYHGKYVLLDFWGTW
jgi:hypothetical protein